MTVRDWVAVASLVNIVVVGTVLFLYIGHAAARIDAAYAGLIDDIDQMLTRSEGCRAVGRD